MNHFRHSMLLFALLTAPLFSQDDRESIVPTGWRTMTNQSVADIQSMSAQGYRPIDLEIQSTSPLRFTMTYVHNSGSYQTAWSMLVDKTGSEIAAGIPTGRRLARLTPYEVGGQTRYCAIFVDNQGSNYKPWYWWYGKSLAYIQGRLSALNARLIDVESHVVGSTRYYCGIAIRNTGADFRSFKVFANFTTTDISNATSTYGMRVYDIERVASGRYDVILVKPTVSTSSWFYVGRTMAQLDALTRQNGARLFDVERYVVAGTPYYAALMIQNTNALTTAIGRTLRADTDGASGFLLKRINGSTLAALQRSFAFDPASTIKQLHGAFAYRRALLDSKVSELTNIPYRDGPCPYDTGTLRTETLENAVQKVLENSDNRLTDAIERFFGGKSALHAFANSIGMTSTRSNRIMGCTAPPYNTMTLDDLGRLHTEITNGLLGQYREDFINRMLNSRSSFPGTGLNYMNTVLLGEQVKAGLSASEYQSFLSRFRLAYKPGAKTINGKFHRTTSGWAQIPFIVNNAVEIRQYAWGAFAHAASDDTKASNAVSKAVHELLRDRIAAAMATWKGFQFGSFTKFGSSCQVGSRTPRHEGTGKPELGQVANFELHGGPSFKPALLWIGASKSFWNGGPLPVSLITIGAPGCRLYVAPHAALGGSTDLLGRLTFKIPLAGSKNLIGLTFYTQFAMAAPNQNAAGFVTSNGLATMLGGVK